jgi:iron complex outermembrane receptor protein
MRRPSTINTALNLNGGVSEVPVGGGVTAPLEQLLRGNPDFVSEKVVSYELGYRCQVTKSFSVDARSYYNNETHALDVVTGAVQPGNPLVVPITFSNGGQEDSYGGEISGSLRVSDNWRLSASYSLLHYTAELAAGSKGTVLLVDHAQSAPEHQAQLHSYLDITRNLQFNAAVYFTGSVGEFNVPAFVSTDLNLTWEPRPGLVMSVGVLNLVDNQHLEFGTTAGQGYADQIPRTVYAQMTYRF